MSWPAILLTPTMKASLSLRRICFDPCPAKPYGMESHDARTFIGTTAITITGHDVYTWHIMEKEPPPTDPRWPTICQCGYAFTEGDYRQMSSHRLYTPEGRNEELTIREARPGMIWNAPWLIGAYRMHPSGPDGQFLIMRLPDGQEWAIDGPSTNGPGWIRVGTPPLLTVTPSILSKDYHGFLTAGVLTDDLEGRTYET